MPALIKVDLQQLKELISQLDTAEKEDLAKFLDDMTLRNRWNNLLNSKRDIPLTDDEITAEVEKVRSSSQ